MRDYNVRISELLEMTVSVVAENMTQAQRIAEQNWKNCEYVLDASNIKNVKFETLYPQYRDYGR